MGKTLLEQFVEMVENENKITKPLKRIGGLQALNNLKNKPHEFEEGYELYRITLENIGRFAIAYNADKPDLQAWADTVDWVKINEEQAEMLAQQEQAETELVDFTFDIEGEKNE